MGWSNPETLPSLLKIGQSPCKVSGVQVAPASGQGESPIFMVPALFSKEHCCLLVFFWWPVLARVLLGLPSAHLGITGICGKVCPEGPALGLPLLQNNSGDSNLFYLRETYRAC